jgi:hypothetical protein
VKVAVVVLAAFLVLIGGGFAGQGLGYLPGSIMTGDIKWFWIGGLMVVVGLALAAAVLVRRPKRA